MAVRVYKARRVPSLETYLMGLRAIEPKLTPLQRDLLIRQQAFPDATCFAADLARAVGASGHWVVNRQYANGARKFCLATGWEPEERDEGGTRWWSVWSDGFKYPKGKFAWAMHPVLRTALLDLGWARRTDGRAFPDEVPTGRGYAEAAVRLVTVNAYERDARARLDCIAGHGRTCTVCGFDFALVYPSLGDGFIHVHHMRPLGDGAGERAVDPVVDLRPVCPNCHAMLHRREPPLSIEELQDVIAGGRARPATNVRSCTAIELGVRTPASTGQEGR